jgi:TPP-dependent indolepyruvate ferredoxin oxidoreductase alpha subunit
MTSMILSGRARPDSSVQDARVLYKTFHTFSMDDSLEALATALDHEPYAIVVTTQRCFSGKKRKDSTGSYEEAEKPVVKMRTVISGIVTRIDLLDFVSNSLGGE